MNNVSQHFSAVTAGLISASREVALELGHEAISTVHFLIADCESGRPDSLLELCVSTKENLETYKNSLRKKKSWGWGSKNKSLPITQEFEQALQNSVTVMQVNQSACIEPAHVVLGALNTEGSLLAPLFYGRPHFSYELMQFGFANGIFKKTRIPADDPDEKADLLLYEKVKLEIEGISYSASQNTSYGIRLVSREEKRMLVLVAGGDAATSLGLALHKVVKGLPATHELMLEMLTATGYQLEEIHINRFLDGVFHALIVIRNEHHKKLLHSKPSDAVILAVMTDASIYTSNEMLEAAGIDTAD